MSVNQHFLTIYKFLYQKFLYQKPNTNMLTNIVLSELNNIELAYNESIISLVNNSIGNYESEIIARSQLKSHKFTLSYGEDVKVDRVFTASNGKKDFYPKYLNSQNQWISKGILEQDEIDILPYHYENLHLAQGKWLSVHEGEKPCDYALSRGLISTCLIGCATNNLRKNYKIINYLFQFVRLREIKGLIYFADNDDIGIKKAIEFRDICLENNIYCIILPINLIYPKANQGDDFVEFSKSLPNTPNKRIKSNIESAIKDQFNTLINIKFKQKDKQCSTITSSKIKDEKENIVVIKDSWINKATNELFNGDWISLAGKLYQYNGKIYEEKETVIIKRKIVHWCANYVDERGKKSKANPTSVENIFKWVNALFGISPSQVNCEGIPLKNGYLKLIKDENNNPKFELKPYSPEVYFTYQSEVSYDPKASQESAIKLLECLDEPYKSLFIKSISTVLSFRTIKEKWDRIKALLLIGDGSNGKDTLREGISLIFGEQGITSCSLNDFSQSRGFNLARLATNPKLNWSSENKEINIDSIQSLKQAITGDPLFIEGKGKDGFEIKLNTFFVFNTNHKPDLKGNQFAMQSRLTLIPFPHTFSMRPKKGELQADPRFKHDKNFLVNVLAPGLLNLLIDAFGEVYQNGINYQESENYFNEVIEENNHLRKFAKERGLVYTGNDNDRLSISDIYSPLIQWYFDNGYLDFETKNEKVKNIWLDDNKKDPVIKLSKDLKPRILELFPKVKEKCPKGKKYLCGIKFDVDSPDSPENPETIDNKEFKVNHVDSPIDSPLTNLVTHLATNLDSPNLKNGSNSIASQTQNDLSKSKTDLSLNQESYYQDIDNDNEPKIINNESKNQKSESRLVNRLVKGESKVSQQVSQQKPENPNKNNTFINLGESTLKNKQNKKNEKNLETKKEPLFKKIEYREAINTINDYLEQVEKITDKNEKRLFVSNFFGKETISIIDLSDQEIIDLYDLAIRQITHI